MSLDKGALAEFLRAAKTGTLSRKDADAVAKSLVGDGFDAPNAYTSINILGNTMQPEYEPIFHRAATSSSAPDVRSLALRNLCARLALADKYIETAATSTSSPYVPKLSSSEHSSRDSILDSAPAAP